MNRLLYFIYYLKQLDYDRLLKFKRFTIETQAISWIQMWGILFFNSIKYNISPTEYFQFNFFKLSKSEKKTWAGTGAMYEYQKIMNPKNSRKVLNDKRLFHEVYASFTKHLTANYEQLTIQPRLLNQLLNVPSKKIVFKTATGQCGRDIQIKEVGDFNAKSLTEFMKKSQFDLIEEFIIQHPKMNHLSPSGVNTVRIITQLDNSNNIHILGCRQRITINAEVDNMAAGNIVAVIDEMSGKIISNGYYSDITMPIETHHPVTNVKIKGFQVPFWNETITMVKAAAIQRKENRSVGWDIAITPNGPDLIEGNHDWCKLVWQLPLQKGQKAVLESFLS